MPRGARGGKRKAVAPPATPAGAKRRRRRRAKAESPDRGTTRSGASFSAERKAYYDSYAELVRVHPKTFSTAASLYTVGRRERDR